MIRHVNEIATQVRLEGAVLPGSVTEPGCEPA
jgi:hypothetical protein